MTGKKWVRVQVNSSGDMNELSTRLVALLTNRNIVPGEAIILTQQSSSGRINAHALLYTDRFTDQDFFVD